MSAPAKIWKNRSSILGITLPKTKVVCTIGLASETSETIRELIANGMRVARLNFSHGTHSDHAQKIHIFVE